MSLSQLDNLISNKSRQWGLALLRISVGVVFLWFGALKVLDVSPVVDLIMGPYGFMPERPFILVLGIWEVVVGLGLISKVYLRTTIILLWLQMGGVFMSLVLMPLVFFDNGNPLLITFEGEFVIKNIVILAATLVTWGYEIKKA